MTDRRERGRRKQRRWTAGSNQPALRPEAAVQGSNGLEEAQYGQKRRRDVEGGWGLGQGGVEPGRVGTAAMGGKLPQ